MPSAKKLGTKPANALAIVGKLNTSLISEKRRQELTDHGVNDVDWSCCPEMCVVRLTVSDDDSLIHR
jgi:hypothetical protein